MFGPADAPLGLIRGRRRKRFLVRADRGVDLQGFLAAWRARAKVPGSVRVTIDVDPYSFLSWIVVPRFWAALRCIMFSASTPAEKAMAA